MKGRDKAPKRCLMGSQSRQPLGALLAEAGVARDASGYAGTLAYTVRGRRAAGAAAPRPPGGKGRP